MAKPVGDGDGRVGIEDGTEAKGEGRGGGKEKKEEEGGEEGGRVYREVLRATLCTVWVQWLCPRQQLAKVQGGGGGGVAIFAWNPSFKEETNEAARKEANKKRQPFCFIAQKAAQTEPWFFH